MIRRYAVIKDNVCENVILAEDGFVLDGYMLIPDDNADISIGAKFENGQWIFPQINQDSQLESIPSVPKRITRRQARLALLEAGLLDVVEQIMADPETPRAARITYEDAAEWHRDDPLIVTFAKQLDLSDEQIDALFVRASTL